jgi:hypothetical protein
MNSQPGKTEFIQGLKQLVDLSNSVKYKNVEYLIFFSLGEEDDSLIITITDGFNYLWAKELDYNDFNALRKTLGLEGTYANYFQLFREAMQMLNGSYKIEIQPVNSELDLTINYKISKTATLTGAINIGSPIHFENDKTMFRQFVRKTLFDLQTSKKRESSNLEKEVFELKEKLKQSEEKVANLQKNMPNIEALPNAGDNKEADNKKKKAQTSILHPFMKKTKRMGAKIGGGDD